jgi:hypothetical protein
MFDVRGSMFDVRGSMFDVRGSMLSARAVSCLLSHVCRFTFAVSRLPSRLPTYEGLFQKKIPVTQVITGKNQNCNWFYRPPDFEGLSFSFPFSFTYVSNAAGSNTSPVILTSFG